MNYILSEKQQNEVSHHMTDIFNDFAGNPLSGLNLTYSFVYNTSEILFVDVQRKFFCWEGILLKIFLRFFKFFFFFCCNVVFSLVFCCESTLRHSGQENFRRIFQR